MQAATLWILLGLGIELILIGLITYAFITLRKERLAQPWRKDVELLKNHVSQADALMDRIYQELNGRFGDFKELFQKLEYKEAQLNELVTRAGEASTGLDSSVRRQGVDMGAARYRHVIWLRQEGYSRDEISKRTGVSDSEIELVLRLKGKGRR